MVMNHKVILPKIKQGNTPVATITEILTVQPMYETFIEPLLGEWTRGDIVTYWVKQKDHTNLDIIKEWCTSTYGPELSTRNDLEWRWFHMSDKVIFRFEADRLMFTLRWS